MLFLEAVMGSAQFWYNFSYFHTKHGSINTLVKGNFATYLNYGYVNVYKFVK